MAKGDTVPVVEVQQVTTEHYLFNGQYYESHLAALEARRVAMIVQHLVDLLDPREELCKWTIMQMVKRPSDVAFLLNDHAADIELKGLRRG